ncbi:MAG: bifunctional DNA primase/polymerase [Nitrososphaerota archaeon]
MRSASDFLKFYLSRGLTILPVLKNEKGPPIYDSWPSLTREEILRRNASVDWQNYNLALRLDDLVVVDVEKPELYDVIFKQPIEVFARVTWIQRTGKGYHILFRGHAKPFKVEGFIEIRSGPQQYILVAPSIHPSGKRYEWISDISKTPIIEISDHDLERLRRKLEVLKRFSKFIEAMTEYWKKFHRHNLSLWLSGVLRKIGLSVEDAELILKAIALLSCDEELKDRLTALKTTYERPIEEVGAWSYLKRELESIVGPEHAAEILKLMPKIDEEIGKESAEKIKKAKVSKPIKIDGVLIEPVECGLAVYRDGHIEIRETYEHGGHILVKDPWLDGVVVLPPEPINIEPKTLWEMTRKYVEKYVYLEDPRLYDVLTAFIGWSYFYDQNNVTCYLYINGPYGSGKTRLLEVLRMLCYRGVLSSIARGPSLFRLIERLGSLTLLIDESMIRDKDVSDLLRVGYRRGNVIIRAEKENDGFELRKFETYCLKAFASVEEPSEDIKQRSLTINMIKNLRPVGKKLDENMARGIRGGWLYQRLTNKIEVTGNEYASRYQDARIEEICSPLMAIALRFNPEAAEAIKGYFEDLEEARAAEIRATLEAEIIEYLLKRDYDESGCTFVSVSDLVMAFNNRYSDRKIGRAMSRLGFKKRRDKVLGRGYEIDRNLLRKLAVIYRVEPPEGAINHIILES